jgi:hypothetical protein
MTQSTIPNLGTITVKTASIAAVEKWPRENIRPIIIVLCIATSCLTTRIPTRMQPRMDGPPQLGYSDAVISGWGLSNGAGRPGPSPTRVWVAGFAGWLRGRRCPGARGGPKARRRQRGLVVGTCHGVNNNNIECLRSLSLLLSLIVSCRRDSSVFISSAVPEEGWLASRGLGSVVPQ